METRHAIALLELPHVGAHAVHDARDVITAVGIVLRDQLGNLPVFRVAAGYNDADDDLVRLGFWDRDVLDCRLEAFGDDGFFHSRHCG